MIKLAPDFLTGSYPPIVTPFRDGKVDLADTDRGRATPVAQDPDEESAI